MGFLKNVMNAQRAGIPEQWKVLERKEQVDQLLNDSHKKPIGILKHSTRCGISSMMKHQLEAEWDLDTSDIDFYYLDLISNRAISNKVAEVLDVRHQSPQIIIVKDGKAVYDTSHHGISVAAVRKGMSA